jgi:hypothetical protein
MLKGITHRDNNVFLTKNLASSISILNNNGKNKPTTDKISQQVTQFVSLEKGKGTLLIY